jgi:transposase
LLIVSGMRLTARKVNLSEAQRIELEKLSGKPTAQRRMAQRARCVLMCADGHAVMEVARRLAMTPVTVRKWRDRYVERGLDGLADDPRPGQPRKLSARTVQAIARATQFEQPPAGRTHWSRSTMAKRFGTNATMIGTIWQTYGLQPHRSETFKISTDPKLVEKVHDIVGLYLNPPDKALVLCVDEKSQIQALDRTQPLLPLRPGQVERRTHDYVRHGTACLFAALDIQTGKVIGHVTRRHRHQEFLELLRKLDRETPANMDLHLVLDNYGTHKHKRVRAWLDLHPRFHLHFTPTGASWLNMIESWFSALTRNRIRRGVFHSLRELITALQEYIRINNGKPRPFTWTKTPTEILSHSHMIRN